VLEDIESIKEEVKQYTMNEQNETLETNQTNNNLTNYRECKEGFNDDETHTNIYFEINQVSYRNEKLKYRKYQVCHKTCKLEIPIPIKIV